MESTDERDAVWLAERRDYLSTLIHALNQPLTAIANYLEGGRAQLRPDSEPLLREAIESAAQESRRAVHIAREVSATLGRRDRSVAPELDVPSSLEALAEDLAARRGAEVALDLATIAGPARGSAFAFRRSLARLVGAAIQGLGAAEGSAVPIRLVARPADERVRIDIELRAAGADPAARDRWVRALERDPAAALARSSLADHGGRVDFDVVEGPSLRIRIHLLSA